MSDIMAKVNMDDELFEKAIKRFDDSIWHSFGVGLSHELRSYFFTLMACVNSMKGKLETKKAELSKGLESIKSRATEVSKIANFLEEGCQLNRYSSPVSCPLESDGFIKEELTSIQAAEDSTSAFYDMVTNLLDEELSMMRQSIETSEKLLNTFFNIARGKASEIQEDVDAYELVGEAVALSRISDFYKKAPKKIKIEIVGEKEKCICTGVIKTEMFTVLTNIIRNAIEAISRGDQSGNILIRIDKGAIHIADNGPGMPKDNGFFRSSQKKDGGVGLFICNKLAHRNGCRLEINTLSFDDYNTVVSIIKKETETN